jgi:transcriptional regulator with XRE-family HTH domain
MLHTLVKAQRLRKGWSIRQLALYSGVHQSRLSRFELGKGDIGSKQMIRVMLLLDFQISTRDQVMAIDAMQTPANPAKLIVEH